MEQKNFIKKDLLLIFAICICLITIFTVLKLYNNKTEKFENWANQVYTLFVR